MTTSPQQPSQPTPPSTSTVSAAPYSRLPDKPRKVRRGLKLVTRPDRLGINRVSRDWLALIASAPDPIALQDGLQYARAGQVARLEVQAGSVEAEVQGRAARRYHVRLEVARISHEHCEKFIRIAAGEARLAHDLVDGQPSDAALDVASRLGIPLIPRSFADSDVTVSCSCPQCAALNHPPAARYVCKHILAAAYVLAEQLDQNPVLAWRLRGIDPVELIERVRLQRTLDSGVGPATAHQPTDRSILMDHRSNGSPDVPPLDVLPPPADPRGFFELPHELLSFETRLEKPEVSHVLLRRLGPSPFEHARFPILGLLATCYDLVSDKVYEELHEELTDAEAQLLREDQAAGVSSPQEREDQSIETSHTKTGNRADDAVIDDSD